MTNSNSVSFAVSVGAIENSYDVLVSSEADFLTAVANNPTETTIAFAPGTYSLTNNGDSPNGIFNGLNRTEAPLTVTSQYSSNKAVFGDRSLMASGTAFVILDGLRFYRTKAEVSENWTHRFLGHSSSSIGNNITIRNCDFWGETLTEAELTQTENYTQETVPSPFTISAHNASNLILENNDFRYVRTAGGYALFDGVVIRGNTVNYCFDDYFRFIGQDSGSEESYTLIEGNILLACYGKVNELATQAPHPDSFQTFNNGGATDPKSGTVHFRRNIVVGQDLRGSASQGIFSQANIKRLLVDQCFILTNSVHGVSADRANTVDQAIVINTTSARWTGVGETQLRYNTLEDGEIAVISAHNNLFSGPFGAASDPDNTVVEQSNNEFLADYSTVFTGPFSPDSAAEALAAFTPQSGFTDKGAIDASGALTNKAYPPLHAAPPTLTGGTGQFTCERAVPSDSGGSSITSYNLRYRVVDTLAWTTVSGISASEIVGSLGADTYEVQTRAVNAISEGFWTNSASVVVS